MHLPNPPLHIRPPQTPLTLPGSAESKARASHPPYLPPPRPPGLYALSLTRSPPKETQLLAPPPIPTPQPRMTPHHQTPPPLLIILRPCRPHPPAAPIPPPNVPGHPPLYA